MPKVKKMGEGQNREALIFSFGGGVQKFICPKGGEKTPPTTFREGGLKKKKGRGGPPPRGHRGGGQKKKIFWGPRKKKKSGGGERQFLSQERSGSFLQKDGKRCYKTGGSPKKGETGAPQKTPL